MTIVLILSDLWRRGGGLLKPPPPFPAQALELQKSPGEIGLNQLTTVKTGFEKSS